MKEHNICKIQDSSWWRSEVDSDEGDTGKKSILV